MKNHRLQLIFLLLIALVSCNSISRQNVDTLGASFLSPPDHAKPRVYWWWLYNRVNKEGITRDLEEFKAKGISGVNLICTGGYAGIGALPGVEWLGPEWRALYRYAVQEAKRLDIEMGFNMAGGWTMMGPWVTPDHAMKKVVQSERTVTGPRKYSGQLKQPETVDGYYKDIWVQAFKKQDTTKKVDPQTAIDLTDRLKSNGELDWEVPEGEWVILRSGYTLTGHPWSRWFAYPKGDTFEGGDGYEIDYMSTAALDEHFDHLGKLILEETRLAGGKLAYLWSDSWECGKLTWTQDFPNQFRRFRGYDLKPYMPILAGYTMTDSTFTARFQDDFDRTVQDCVAENYYGHFYDLCHQNDLNVGNEAGGPNDTPPMDALKNLGRCDIPTGEFWARYELPEGGMNSNQFLRLNLKQTASAAHIYGKREAMAESFTQMEQDRTHWSLGPFDLKPYANDALCEGINRFMLHQSTCQPPEDGKPGFEFCAGQHFTPNSTWWEQSPAFFTYLSRCQYLLQEGKFVGDVCFYLGEQTPTLAPPKYIVPTLGVGYDCDYTNAEVLLTRMSVEDGRIVLPDGMSYHLLYLQNCVSPVEEISQAVGRYQQLKVPAAPSDVMSLEVIQKVKELIYKGATVIGAPPKKSAELKGYPACDDQVREIAAEIWGDLDGKTRTERTFGKGRIIWGKTAREVLLADGVQPDFSYAGQSSKPEMFDYIHRTNGDTEIYFVINRTDRTETNQFTFRVAGKQPEIWNPVTGEMRDAGAFKQEGGLTTLPLELAPYDSYFIVFRKPISDTAKGKEELNFPKLEPVRDLSDAWTVTFDTAWGGPGEVHFDTLANWIDRPEEGIKFYSGTTTYQKTFDLHKNTNERLILDLGDVKHVAEVRLNGVDLGILWCAPWQVDLTECVKETGNVLEVDVINLWANRVIGDWTLPVGKRFTKTHDAFRFDMLRGSTPLTDAGLLGPVRILKYQITKD